ncbi:MAG TPA: late competence development ComFB family protein [Gemmatimonadales bacterium]|jgi:hypothetical protein
MILNVMERHVRDAYDRLKTSVKEFADSAEHREDVIVYALNRLPPRYVVTDAGKAVTEVALDGAQQRAEIDVKVLEAMRFVAARPRSKV